MPEIAGSSFHTLRMWNGEQSRAFEELSFQLLKDQVPLGTRAIRTGNPDGGVEWYASLPDGSEWGWQAKHVRGIDALLTAMTGSVRRVANERPRLRQLTFVISWNLATGTSGREQKSQRQKYEDKIKTWQESIPGGDNITFELVQESDLVNELAKPEHSGRRWFWWNELVLGHDWLVQRYDQQAAAASEKYRPDLQVDVPIQEDLLALGFDQSIFAVFDRLRRDVVSAVADLHLSPEDDAAAVSVYRTILDTAAALKTSAGALTLQAGDPVAVFETLTQQLVACEESIEAAEDYERRLVAEWRELPDDDAGKAKKPQERASFYGVHNLRTTINELASWLESTSGLSFQRRAYFLTGKAGSGKTHLLLDATRRALDGDRPAVFLAGAQFGQGNLWGSIADQLGLQPVGADVLLRAMDAAGEAASMSGRRFVIFVDALNETTPADFWRIHLPTLRAAIVPYPHVALAVSCRDTYQDLILDGAEGSHYVCQTHPGFAEREVEATQRYFAHYGLEAPKIPLLTPEFTLPLFLRLYCESLSQTTPDSIPAGHQGRVVIFERYLAAKTSTVARRFRPSASSAYELNATETQVGSVIDALLDELSRRGRESMSASAAEAVARVPLEGSAADATRLLGLLQEEGVLTREPLYLGDGNFDEGVRIVFQAFADFLLLKRRLALAADPLNDPSVKSWLADDCSLGIIEAATILFPEVFDVELPDLLGIKLSLEPKRDDQSAWERHNRASQLYRSLVETLPYRDSRAISQRTIDLLNEAQAHLSRQTFYRVLFTLAPQPGSRLNGDGLHRYLLQRPMPRRDRDFGFATYHELLDPFSPSARLARWAAAGPYPAYDANVIELACIPLCWLLSSPNRFMRDWVTKALVQLLRGHLDVMRALVERFWTVDDPYVVQRVVVIAYGSLLRSTPEQTEQAKAVAELVHDLVFTRPMRPDELLLDAARGVVRWAVAQELLPAANPRSWKRPYGLKLPGPPPLEATLEAKYGWREGQPDDESYSSVYSSLMSMGDFGRYVVEPGLRHFSRYRVGQDYPKRRSREPRFVKSRWQGFIRSLNDEQQRALAERMFDPARSHISRRDLLLGLEVDPLSETQRALLDAAFVYPKPVNHAYPAENARRWIVRRTIGLGWIPKLFGPEDRSLSYMDGGREAHKAERWGKKYQWMAYHELLARVADNYHASRLYADGEPYEGLHQIGDREIDPSLPPIDYRAFSENGGHDTAAWDPPLIQLQEWPPARLDFSRYQGDIRRFLADTASEPSVARSMFVLDRDGDEWLVLASFVKQVDSLTDKGWRGLQEHTSIDTLLIAADGAEAFHAALGDDETRPEFRDLLESDGHTNCCYACEVGRIGPRCPHRHDALRLTTSEDRSFQVAPTTERYSWDGNSFDCSIGASATVVLPSTFIQQSTGLTFDTRGPSWLDAAGSPVFTYYEVPGNDSRALLVRAAFLQGFLTAHNLELIVLHRFERMQLGGDFDGERPYVESSTTERFPPDLGRL